MNKINASSHLEGHMSGLGCSPKRTDNLFFNDTTSNNDIPPCFHPTHGGHMRHDGLHRSCDKNNNY